MNLDKYTKRTDCAKMKVTPARLFTANLLA